MEERSKLAAGLLGIFLGGLGIHNFYLGYTKRGMLQMIVYGAGMLTLWFFGIGMLLMAGMSIWGLVEGILILSSYRGYETDAQSNPLNN
jgi:TM2 domain-containing membrane protein YozV